MKIMAADDREERSLTWLRRAAGVPVMQLTFVTYGFGIACFIVSAVHLRAASVWARIDGSDFRAVLRSFLGAADPNRSYSGAHVLAVGRVEAAALFCLMGCAFIVLGAAARVHNQRQRALLALIERLLERESQKGAA